MPCLRYCISISLLVKGFVSGNVVLGGCGGGSGGGGGVVGILVVVGIVVVIVVVVLDFCVPLG